MIPYDRARRLVLSASAPLMERVVRLSDAMGLVISRDLRSLIDWPLFDNSAMDGYALDSRDTQEATSSAPVRLKIVGSLRAGGPTPSRRPARSAYRIMTGARMPRGTDAVVEKERAHVETDEIVLDRPVDGGRHVRRRAEELRRGASLPCRGAVITPGLTGLLACLGMERVPVHRAPRVGLLATGDELAAAGAPLRRGAIYDSNTPMLRAALRGLGPLDVRAQRVRDVRSELTSAVGRMLEDRDVVVLTGGVSVGEYDQVKDVLGACGVRRIFWGVLQKPGKPVYFGRKGECLVFGLPGNAASAYVAYYQYVYPALRRLMGRTSPALPEEYLPLECAVEPDPVKTLLMRAATCRRGGVVRCRVLRGQSSHMLLSMRWIEGFVVVPPGSRKIRAGEKVLFQRLPEGG